MLINFLKHKYSWFIFLSEEKIIIYSSKDIILYQQQRLFTSVVNLLNLCSRLVLSVSCTRQSSLIAEYLRSRATFRNIKLYAFVEELAASGGYLLACAADQIFVSKYGTRMFRCGTICKIVCFIIP